MNQERINEVLSDEIFMKQLLQMETVEEAQAAFKSKGIDFSLEELKKIKELRESDLSGDLSLDQLDDVAGGSAVAVVAAAVVAVAVRW